MNRRLLATFLLLLSMISSSWCEKSCQTCAPLTPEECPLINECNICTETTFTRRQNRNGCQEVTISCASGSRVILELSNGHSVSRKAATLGSFSCQSNGRWQLNGLNYTEKNVKSASCYTASPDRQNSPINLVTQRAIRDLDLIDFTINYAPNDGDSISWGGNATTFTIKSRAPYTNSKFSATQTDGVTYNLYQMHAHWSHLGANGSEHTVDGQRYVAEFHFVHFDPEYGTFDNAVGKENGIAVIAVLAELGKRNAEFDKILNAIKKGDAQDSVAGAHTVNGVNFNYRKLIPGRSQFFTYTGSLTTGDYNTCVDWTVMRYPITVSVQQMSILYSFHIDNHRENQSVLPGTIIRKNFA